uniref:C2H2-type domain-containing protein n=1 Tax=Psilocybe cubensis TaxID=181762 RepID=A0A8H8CP12_PSICU
MYQRDPRSFAYDDQGAAYSSGHNSADYPPNGYPHPQSSGHYYAPPGHGVGGAHEGVNSGPYFRSMTPSLVAANRYPRDPRYYNQQGFGGSSSSTSQSLYASQNQPYPPQYLPTSDQRSVPLSPTPNPPAHFIPTPSEIAHNYSSYSHHLVTPHSPTSPEDQYHSSADYSSPPHIVPSSHGSQSHRLSRIATGRPQSVSAATSTSPISASSPSGERFPCEKCGKTFSRSHDRKRHHETQHLASPILHICPYCSKEFSR